MRTEADQTSAPSHRIIDVGWDEAAPHRSTAGLVVQVYPIGEPGMVRLSVHNVGPVELSDREAAHLLRSAADSIYPTTEGDE